MAADPTQTQSQTRRPESPASQEWYVVTGGGATAFRLTPGLTVGESDSGALALNDPEVGNQWFEFVLAHNGELWATIVTREKSLRLAGTTCLRHPLEVGATIRLPNNTLYISRDIRKPRLSGTVVEVVHREIPEPLQDLVGPGWEEGLGAVREPHPGTLGVEIPEPSDSTEPAPHQAEARAEPDPDAPDDWSDYIPTMAEPRERAPRPHAAARQRQVAVMAGVLALGAVTLAGVVVVLVSMGEGETGRAGNFDSDRVPAEVADVGPGAQRPPPAPSPPGQSDAATPADAVADGELAGAPGPMPSRETEAADSSSPPPADAVPPSGPAAATEQQPEQVATLPRAETEQPEPVVVPPVERRSIPPAAQTDAQTAGTPQTGTDPQTGADPQPVDSQPDAALVAELEETGSMAQAAATELARRRDLLAADLALAQGRLTNPPESSAYTLYNRVLAVDPGSSEARSGLQSVGQELINRALAQLAGDDLESARRTLQAAADAGADPRLVADLRGEVDHRQQLIEGGSRGSETSINSSR